MKAEIYHYNNWLSETQPQKLKPKLQQLLEESGFWILAVNDHHFEPEGYTCLWMLGESHLALHTFPEESCTYLELSSCNAAMHQKFVDMLEEETSILSSREISEYRPKRKLRAL